MSTVMDAAHISQAGGLPRVIKVTVGSQVRLLGDAEPKIWRHNRLSPVPYPERYTGLLGIVTDSTHGVCLVRVGVEEILVRTAGLLPAPDATACQHCRCTDARPGQEYCSLACETDHDHVSDSVLRARYAERVPA